MSRSELPPVVCALDDHYVTGLCVLMQSLSLAHADGAPPVIVLHQGLSERGRNRIRFHGDRLGLQLELRTVPSGNTQYRILPLFPAAASLRLAIPEMVPESPVVLYLDSDVLVLRDLRPLLGKRLDGSPLAAVRDAFNPTLGGGIALPGWQSLGLPGSREYFNSGVMLLNLPECRRLGLFEECRRFLRTHPEHVMYPDQDPLNWAAADNWSRLDRCWNAITASSWAVTLKSLTFVHPAAKMLPLEQLLLEEESAAVLHFAGPVKPWSPRYPAGTALDRYRSFMRMVAEHEE
jgi:lipopolysaccharide biosynthesis glycosyltransferase